MKVFVAMSGGVDSSTTAVILQRQGHDVVGVTMQLWPRSVSETGVTNCCGVEAIEDARRVANALNIPHYVLNMRAVFEKVVIKDFIDEYSEGRTPNPCIRCNQIIKFDILLKKVLGIGADALATGHYARVVSPVTSQKSPYILKRGVDPDKDQSYFLWTFTQEQLAKTILPLGELTKAEVRELARKADLPVADKADSQEICFVPKDDYRGFLQERGVEAEDGPIMDASGNVLGTHTGVAGYTVGQRKGLRIAAPKPLYVLAIDAKRNVLIVGPETETFCSSVMCHRLNFISGVVPIGPCKIGAQVRYNAPETSALLTWESDDVARIDFDQPQRGVAPGQTVAFYDGDVILGGAVIL